MALPKVTIERLNDDNYFIFAPRFQSAMVAADLEAGRLATWSDRLYLQPPSVRGDQP